MLTWTYIIVIDI